MRITLITDWWPPRVGGVESQVADLAAALVARGHAVSVLTTSADAAPRPGVHVERVPLPMAGPIAIPDLRRVGEIVRHLAARAPDVVHAHGMFSSLAIGGILASRRLGVPSVSTSHSLLRPWPVRAGAVAVTRLLTRSAAVLTGVSAAAAADVARVSGRSVMHIPNALALADWRARRPASPPDRGVHLVAITRLVRKKSPIDLVRALSAVQQAGVRVRMTIAGEGPERARLRREAERLQVSHLLALRGPCTRHEVRDLLAHATVLVHPGTLEAFGLAILEARAAGVPVVAMRAGGVPEIVEHGRHGLLANDARGFASAVARLCSDGPLRARCADAAARDLERYDWGCIVVEYEDAYARALDRDHTSGRHVKNSAAASA